MAQQRDPDVLPFLLVRCNDWVEPVQRAACAAVRARLTPQDAPVLWRHLVLIDWLHTVRRNALQDMTDAIETLLHRTLDAAEAALQSPDRIVRRLAFERLITRVADVGPLIERALTDRDARLRAWALQRLDTSVDAARLETALAQLSRDPSPAIRLASLARRIEQLPESVARDWHRIALDGSAWVRSRLRAFIAARDTIDFAAFYRERIDGPSAAQALDGLAETGTADDADIAATCATTGRPRVRRAAVRAMARLNAPRKADRLLDLLTDSHPGVSREVSRALCRHRGLVPVEVMWAVFLMAEAPHVKRNVLTLVNDLGKWEALPCLIEATRDPDVGDVAEALVNRWVRDRANRGRTMPTPAERSAAMRALESADAILCARITPLL